MDREIGVAYVYLRFIDKSKYGLTILEIIETVDPEDETGSKLLYRNPDLDKATKVCQRLAWTRTRSAVILKI